MRRRAFLSAAGVGLSAAALGGYLATEGSEVVGLDGPDEPTPEPAGPKRGESDAAVGTETVEDDPDVEYLPDENAVRFVARWSSSGVDPDAKTDSAGRRAVYETVPFDRWAETQLLHAAGAVAATHANEELDTDAVGHGVTSRIEGMERAAFVAVSTVLDREGNVAFDTGVEFDALVAATPATVTARYRLADQSVERDVPMFAKYQVKQQL